MKYLAKFLMTIGFAIIVFARIDGVDMAEGELLINYLPHWIIAIGCVVVGIAILKKQ